ncbi:MAG: PBSX family phage terminase large subunit [Deltaproteobacteria bacterium]|nr:PBSX family phage terminase large subunit [Deltaproteobacteria bacterium]
MNAFERGSGPAAEGVREALARVEVAESFLPLYEPRRYKVFYGGRGGAKSWAFARALLVLALQGRKRILCAREFQASIADSVMSLLVDQIHRLKLQKFFSIQKTGISAPITKSEFKFTGLRVNPDTIRSFEGADICWVEEAQRLSKESLDILIPTIRKAGSEIWFSFNPEEDSDPVWTRFALNPPPGALVVKVGWADNPWFPAVLNEERLYMLENDPDAYDHVWEGNCRKIGDAVIFKGKYSIEEFETPPGARFYFGADWGFGADPTTLIRCFEQDRVLFVDQESYAVGLDLDRIAETWKRDIPGCDKWPIYADASQPQTVRHVRGFGFRVDAAKKWPGSVEDGITFLRGYKQIKVHKRCTHTADEMRKYSYKTDSLTREVFPVALDKHNHCIDAIRYGLNKKIRRRGGVI